MLLSLLVPASLAATPILVTDFEALDPALASLAAMFDEGLTDALTAQLDVDPLPLTDESDLYVRSCPPGQRPGCALVVGDRAGATWAITGQLEERGAEVRVSLAFVQVPRSDVFEITARVGARSEDWARFTEMVAEGLRLLIETDGVREERRARPAAHRGRPDDEEARSLDAIFGEVLLELSHLRHVPRPEALFDEGPPPDPADRRGELVLEAAAGGLWGITGGDYRGEIVTDAGADTLASRGILAATPGLSASAALGLGVGLTRGLDVAARGRLFAGDYRQEVRWSVDGGGETTEAAPPRSAAGGALEIVLHARPRGDDARRVGPSVEAGFARWWLPLAPDTRAALPESLPRFDTIALSGLRLAPGAAWQTRGGGDLVLSAPLYLLAGPRERRAEEGDDALLSSAGLAAADLSGALALELSARPRLDPWRRDR